MSKMRHVSLWAILILAYTGASSMCNHFGYGVFIALCLIISIANRFVWDGK